MLVNGGYNMKTHELINSMKSVDWYFEYIEGDLRRYNKAHAHYRAMIDTLKAMPDKQLVRSLIAEYVPTVVREQALKDAKV